MMKESYQIADLIFKKIRGTISSEEQLELDAWVEKEPGNRAIYDRATDTRRQMEKMEIYNLFSKEKVWSALEEELFPTRKVNFTGTKFFRLAAAILLPALIVGGAAYMFLKGPGPSDLAALDEVIKPGTQRAVLILSDGSTVNLDDAGAPVEIEDRSVRIRNEHKLLSYFGSQDGEGAAENVFNEVRTPRGGGYNLKLADGTGVWLNAGSSLKFPVAFTDSSREVYLEGEAYFEVTHSGKPFIVSSGDMNVRVLGTSFNISAYGDDRLYKTTLVEGRVKVNFSGDNMVSPAGTILTPNSQAILDLSTSELSVTGVNASYYTSWRQGKLEFNNESLDVVMKRLARWYDFEYEFENNEAREFHFTARLNNGEQISTILEMLEMTTDVKFEYRKEKIVVL